MGPKATRLNEVSVEDYLLRVAVKYPYSQLLEQRIVFSQFFIEQDLRGPIHHVFELSLQQFILQDA